MNSWVPGAWAAYLQKSCRELRTSALHLEMPHVAAIVDPGGAEIQGKLTLKIPILARFPKIECSLAVDRHRLDGHRWAHGCEWEKVTADKTKLRKFPTAYRVANAQGL